jgi:hypothetical protein
LEEEVKESDLGDAGSVWINSKEFACFANVWIPLVAAVANRL